MPHLHEPFDDGIPLEPPGEDPELARRRRRARTLRRLLVWARRGALGLGVLLALALFAVAATIRHYEANLPRTDEVRSFAPAQVTRILARDGTLLGELFKERRTVVAISDVPAHVRHAVLAAEDAGFYEHQGLNYLGMLRALFVNLRHAGARQGGSTITQQVVKNVLLTPERTFDRKMREVLLARRIEQELSKDELLELYLNYIYFGHGRYGIEEAARYYFGKGAPELDLAEGALLAGIIKGPSVYSPRVDAQRAEQRRRYVLEQMLDKGLAKPAEVARALEEPFALATEPERASEIAPEVVAEAERVLRQQVGEAAARGGYTVTTSIDPALQAAARAAVRKNLDAYAKRHKLVGPLKRGKKEPEPEKGPVKTGGGRIYRGVVLRADDAAGVLEIKVGDRVGVARLPEAERYNPEKLSPSRFAEVGKVVRVSVLGLEGGKAKEAGEARLRLRLELGPQSALVAVDVEKREVLALVGGYEGSRGGLDRASFARRQPGSTFKAFVYSYALHAKTMTPATLIDVPESEVPDYASIEFKAPKEGPPPRLRQAVAKSVNSAAVWTLSKVGATNVVAWAESMGISSKLGADLSLALGSYDVTPREMAAAYATFAAGGVYDEPVLVTRIVGPEGEVPLPPRETGRRVMSEEEAFLTTSLLRSVVEEGTGARAKAIGRPVAGKTGTTNIPKTRETRDAWFVGYSPDVACAVWTGFDDGASLGSREVGATAALPAFVDFMKAAHAKRPVRSFQVPQGIVRVSIDPATGKKAYEGQEDALEEFFLPGTEPVEVAEADAGAPSPSDLAFPPDPDRIGAGGSAPADAPAEEPHAEEPGAFPELPPF